MSKSKKAPQNLETVQDLLSHVQHNLNAPKNLYNSFGKYHYRSAESILEAVKPLLPQGATLKLTDEVQQVGNFVFCNSTAIISYKGESESVSAQAGIPESKKGMDLSQVFGASSSYARKYALNGLLLIDDTKDADTDEATVQSQNTPTPLSQVSASDSKSWLNESDKNWSKAKAFVSKNGATAKTLASLETKYKISNANKKLLGFK